jgi:hypothetical protein
VSLTTYADCVEQPILGFHPDSAGEWVVELACGHRQHVRDRPPYLGKPLECPLCDQSVPIGGEAACFAHLLCPDCGVVLDGGPHRPGCASAA